MAQPGSPAEPGGPLWPAGEATMYTPPYAAKARPAKGVSTWASASANRTRQTTPAASQSGDRPSRSHIQAV